MDRTARVIALTLMCLLIGGGCPAAAAQGLPQYMFPGFRGKVVADETGQPLAGVFVLAVWSSGASSPFGPRAVRVLETESRADGTFDLAPWEAAVSTPISHESPGLVLFAAGRDADWSGQRIGRTQSADFRLRLFEGLPENRASQLRKFAFVLGMAWVHLYDQQRPRVLSALDSEWRGLPADAQGNASPSLMFEATVQSMRYGYEQEMLKQK